MDNNGFYVWYIMLSILCYDIMIIITL